MGGDRVKLRKSDKVEWGEKWHYARHTSWMTPCFFIAILFFMLWESGFLWQI